MLEWHSRRLTHSDMLAFSYLASDGLGLGPGLGLVLVLGFGFGFGLENICLGLEDQGEKWG